MTSISTVAPSIPRMQTWPLVWESVTVTALMWGKGRSRSWSSYVAYRRCPHNHLHFDERTSPPDVTNAWGRVPAFCPHHACRRAYRRNRMEA